MKIIANIKIWIKENIRPEMKELYKAFVIVNEKYYHQLDENYAYWEIPVEYKGYKIYEEISNKSLENEFEISCRYFQKYSEKDFDEAVAYEVCFPNLVYEYDDSIDDYFDTCCENCKYHELWENDHGKLFVHQKKILRAPKRNFKKDYGQLTCWRYVISENMKKDFLNAGCTEADFKKVIDKKGELVCWQIDPQNTISGMAKCNDWNVTGRCENCGIVTYESDNKKATYITKEILNTLTPLNKTEELFPGVCIATPSIIMNKELFQYLQPKYKRVLKHFAPIFLKQ